MRMSSPVVDGHKKLCTKRWKNEGLNNLLLCKIIQWLGQPAHVFPDCIAWAVPMPRIGYKIATAAGQTSALPAVVGVRGAGGFSRGRDGCHKR